MRAELKEIYSESFQQTVEKKLVQIWSVQSVL